MLRLFFAIVLILPIYGLAQYPKANIKPSSDFKQKTSKVETDSGTYVLVSYEGKPFKKPPFKNWKYVNPADSLTTPSEQLNYCLAKTHVLNDTAYLFPYYQKAGFVEADEYFEFYEYTRDSIVLLEIGGKFIKANYTNRPRIDWSEAKKELDYSDQQATVNLISSLLYSAADKVENEYVIDKRKITYKGSTKHHPHQAFSNCQYQRLHNGDPLRHWDGYEEVMAQKFSSFYGIRPYVDTFLWASPQQMNIDSSMAVVLANYGTELKDEIKWPLLDENRTCAYTHWYSSALRMNLDENTNGVHFFFDVDSSASFPTIERYFNPFELRQFEITYGDYHDFLTYCSDSMNSLENSFYKKKGITDFRKISVSKNYQKCWTISPDSNLEIRCECLNYYWEWVDQPNINYRKLTHSSMHGYRSELIYREDVAVWNGSLPAEFLEQRISKELAYQTMDSLTYDQARAFWHWRLHIKMKDKKKILADYLTPTYAEWKTIQEGAGIYGRTVKMSYPRRRFTYRVYVHL